MRCSEGMGKMRIEHHKAFGSTYSKEDATLNTRLEETIILKWIVNE